MMEYENITGSVTNYYSHFHNGQEMENFDPGDCGFTEDQCHTLLLMKDISRSISVAITAVTLLILLLLRKYRRFSQRMFVYIIMCNLINSIIHMTSVGQGGLGCQIEGFISQCTGFASFMWICIITIYLARLIIPGRYDDRIERFEWICILLVIVISCGVAALPFIEDEYGPAGVYCGLKDTPSGDNWRLAIWCIPVSVGCVAITITFIVIYGCHLRRTQHRLDAESSQPLLNNIQRYKVAVDQTLIPFTIFAIAYLLFLTCELADRLNEIVTDEHNYPLKIAHRIAGPCFDTAICVVFFVTNGRAEFRPNKFQESIKIHLFNLSRICSTSSEDDDIGQAIGSSDHETQVNTSTNTKSRAEQAEDDFTSTPQPSSVGRDAVSSPGVSYA